MLSYYNIPDGTTQDQCQGHIPEGNLNRVCSNCGNGVCEKWEHVCNCPVDCTEVHDINFDPWRREFKDSGDDQPGASN